ncbi:hypothetical protein HN385_07540 [archaeon]|jgi:hypothetical protein|nr:hypothetical protein [archaeon]MBT3451167.1 hypothetical protein [archaeon]MBT6869701.1 hypothetical protein [archaeon]MBT7192630.1 hypothetical protein [archaeon]MBT7380515.1 hypothetical protein [archaeon]
MGLFFRRKNKAKVPQPIRKVSDEQPLSFSGSNIPPERTIHPEAFKAAAGLEEPLEEESPAPVKFDSKPAGFPTPRDDRPVFERPKPTIPVQEQPKFRKKGPVFIDVSSYRRILGELDELKGIIGELNHQGKSLEASEFNEEKDFNKLKIAIKNAHDNLLKTDQILFKS